MSLTSMEQEKGIGRMDLGAMQAPAPRLQPGGVGYSSWRDHIDVHLQRGGAEGIHRKAMTEVEWLDMSSRTEKWADEALAEALALVSSSGTSSLQAPMQSKLSKEHIEARRLVSSTVERSRKVYGVLYTALPEELRPLVGHIAQGWAYGLWHWLETKYQSTEEDNVNVLFRQWSNLEQEVGESFDAYRARVNKLFSLLKDAKEQPSVRQYAFTLLDNLQPRYTHKQYLLSRLVVN
jgi:hypothetical protein